MADSTTLRDCTPSLSSRQTMGRGSMLSCRLSALGFFCRGESFFAAWVMSRQLATHHGTDWDGSACHAPFLLARFLYMCSRFMQPQSGAKCAAACETQSQGDSKR